MNFYGCTDNLMCQRTLILRTVHNRSAIYLCASVPLW